jgi:uncharacterized protein (TIGR00369 family)
MRVDEAEAGPRILADCRNRGDGQMEASDALHRGFRDAPFIAHLGIELVDIGPGWCEATMDLAEWHRQQNGLVHAGVIATLADHCAGAAASMGLGPGEYVVTAEFKINLLRGARGKRLHCRAEVLKPGRRLAVVESQVWVEPDTGERELVAKLNATMAVLRAA